MKSSVITIDVEDNGLSTAVESRTVVIQTEEARVLESIQRVPFSSNSVEVSFIEGHSTTDGVVTKVKPDEIKIEDQPSPQTGLTENKVLLIPFSGVKKGSALNFKFRMSRKAVPIPGVYSEGFQFGGIPHEQNAEVTISSSKKLNYSADDKLNRLKIESSIVAGKNVLKIKLMKSAEKAYHVSNTSHLPHVDHFSRLDVSNQTSWEMVQKEITDRYDRVANSKQPEAFKKFLGTVPATMAVSEKAQAVHRFLTTEYSYQGSWLSLRNEFFPRELSHFARKKKGDCKDFATAAVALLRELKVQAEPVLVASADPKQRDLITPRGKQSEVPPGIHYFNHVVVRYLDSTGKMQWMDPTISVFSKEQPPTSILNSLALIMKKGVPIERVVHGKSVKGFSEGKFNINLNLESPSVIQGELSSSGKDAFQNSQIFSTLNDEQASMVITYLMGLKVDQKQKVNGKVLRITEKNNGDQFKIGYENIAQWPSENDPKSGISVAPPMPGIIFLLDRLPKKFEGRLHLGFPSETVSTYNFITKYRPKNLINASCLALTTWYSVSREVTETSTGFQVQLREKIREEFLDMDQGSKELENSLSHLRACISAINLYNPKDPNADRADLFAQSDLLGITDEKVEEAYSTAMGKDFTYKLNLVRLAADQKMKLDPKNPLWHYYRAASIMNLGYWSGTTYGPGYQIEALELVNTSLTQFPENERLTLTKSHLLSRLGKLDEATLVFNKAYKIDPGSFRLAELGEAISGYKNDSSGRKAWASHMLHRAKTVTEKKKANARLASYAMDSQDYSSAVKQYQVQLELDPGNPWILHNIALAQKLAGDFKAAKKTNEMIPVDQRPGVNRKLAGDISCKEALSTIKRVNRQQQHGKSGPPATATEIDAAMDELRNGANASESNFFCSYVLAELLISKSHFLKNDALMIEAKHYYSLAGDNVVANPPGFQYAKMSTEERKAAGSLPEFLKKHNEVLMVDFSQLK